ncbi:chorismate pyruvate-lyase family protein [Archaeoglobus sp.]
MNAIHRILMTTDGSVTAIIEAITQKEVYVETVEQRIVKADKDLAELLGIDERDEVNYRVVYLKADGEVYAKAISYTPLKRLDNSFKEDLMKADIPIGRIMKKHGIEARREIRWSKVIEADPTIAEELGIPEGEKLIVRNYDVIRNREVMINITEYFPMKKFEKTG